MKHLRRVLFIFLTGFFATTGQVILAREFMAVFSGNELSIALMFVFWFAGIVAGAVTAGRMQCKRNCPQLLVEVLICLLPVVAMGQTAGIRMLRELVGVSTGQVLSLGQGALGFAAFVLPFAALNGLVFPLLAGLAGDETVDRAPAVTAGMVFWIDAAGSLAGGAAFTFIFAGWLSSIQVEWLGMTFGLGALAVSQMADGGFRRWLGWLASVAAAVAAGALLVGVPVELDQYLVARRWQALVPGYNLVEDRDSRYQNLAVGEREGVYCLYLSGLLGGTFPDPYETAMAVNMSVPQPRNLNDILLVGQGVEGEAQTLLDFPLRRLTLVFLDPEYPPLIMRRLEDQARARLLDPRLEMVQGDAVDFLAHTPRQWDLILLRTPPPATAAFNRYYSREFFALCARHLKAGGVLITGLEGAENYLGGDVGDYAGTLYHTLHSVFQDVQAMPGMRLVFFACATPGVISLDADVLAQRWRNLSPPPSRYFFPEIFPSLLPPERVSWLNAILARPHPINTDRRPIIYLYNLKIWDSATGSRLKGVLAWVEKLTLREMAMAVGMAGLLIIAGCALLALFGKRDSRLAGATPRAGIPSGAAKACPVADPLLGLLGVFIFGLLGMSLELVLIYQFQNLFGYLYSMMGVLFAAFMLGLVVGAQVMNRWLNLGPRIQWWLAAVLLPATMAALTVWVALSFGHRYPGSQVVLFFQVLGAGTLTGAYFPLACALSSAGDSSGRAAARASAGDHGGALVGSALTGLVLLPVLGIDQTIHFLLLLLVLIPIVAISRRLISR